MTAKERGALISKVIREYQDKLEKPLIGELKYSILYNPKITDDLKGLIKENTPVSGETFIGDIYSIDNIKNISNDDIEDYCSENNINTKDLTPEIDNLVENSNVWNYQYIEF